MSKVIFTRTLLTPQEMYGSLAVAGSREPSLGLCYLAGAAREAGFPVEIVDSIPLGLGCKELARAILRKSPRYLGISSVTISIYNAAELARLVKQENKDITIIIGGVHVTALPDETMKTFPNFDIGVIGEGELTAVELLKTLENNRESLGQVPGIIFRKNGNLVRTRPRQLVSNLDDLPYPAWDLLPDLNRYYQPPAWSLNKGPCGLLVLTRGCASKCIYCDRGAFGNFVRAHSVGYILDMIKDLRKRYDIQQIRILDDNFVLLKKHLQEYCHRLIKENLRIKWSCFARADSVEPGLLRLMRRSGCWQISYGIETGAQHIHDLERKRITLGQIEQGIEWTRQAGISTVGFTMIGHPGETVETIKQTIKFCCQLPLDDFKMVYLTPYPSTELYRQADKYGTLNRDWRSMNAYLKPCFVPYGLSESDLLFYRKLAYIRFYLRPKIIFAHLKYIKNLRQFICLMRGVYGLIRLYLGCNHRVSNNDEIS
jgi:radical SAM superfamily enzyme YgiQ (UPF0313 family)